MPSIPLHHPYSLPTSTPPQPTPQPTKSPLPHLLRTPLGLAILEIQGSLNLPPLSSSSTTGGGGAGSVVDLTTEADAVGSETVDLTADTEDRDVMMNEDGNEAGNGNRAQEEKGNKARRQIGRLEFPLLPSSSSSSSFALNTAAAGGGDGDSGEEGVKEGPWMKKVWLYIGRNQRLAGEVRRLARPVGVLRRREAGLVGRSRIGSGGQEEGVASESGRGREKGGVELEIVEVVRWKVFFGGRPEFV